MEAKIYVTLKKSIADPQGTAIQGALKKMGYQGLKEVRIGKLIEISFKDSSKEEAKDQLEEMCKRLLANTTMEQYDYEIID